MFVFVLGFSCLCCALCTLCLSLPHPRRHDLFLLLLLCLPFDPAKLTLCRVRVAPVHPHTLFLFGPMSG